MHSEHSNHNFTPGLFQNMKIYPMLDFSEFSMNNLKNFIQHGRHKKMQQDISNISIRKHCHYSHLLVRLLQYQLERRNCDRHGLGSKPTRAILLCPWKRHFTALSPAWWS